MNTHTPSIKLVTAALLTAFALMGCHQKPAPHATAEDVAAAKEEAARDVAQAKVEATKDLKSATKIAGSGSPDASKAKQVGKFDIAMVQAEGDHKVAVTQCLTLPSDAQPACTQQADRDFEAAKDAVKATRVSKR